MKIFHTKDGKIIKAPFTEHVPRDVTACIFWLKNRRKEQWRDVQNVAAALGHYVISELTEEEWAAERAQILDADSRTLTTEAETDTDKS